MKPVTMILTLTATLALALPAAPAAAATTSAASTNGPTYCVVFPFLPQCKLIWG
ncbi:MAG: hypothetical protein KJ041_09495 [Gammaproteobacteria bacterium]|nr:hypothetical protein [Gammaproteobacteria bacterium]